MENGVTKQIEEALARISVTYKTHEIQADIYHVYNIRLLWSKIIITGLASASGIVSLLTESWNSFATAVFATCPHDCAIVRLC